MGVISILGAMPTRNAQFTTFEGAPRLAGDAIKASILVGDPTCQACPVACKKEVETPDGKFHVHMESFEYESAWAFGPACLNDDPDAIAYITDLCNDYGMDSIEMGNVLAMAMEASERELITERIAWGDTDAMVELVRRTALRRGHRRHAGRGNRAGGDVPSATEHRDDREGSGDRRLRPARAEGHGPRLRHQQSRRLPPARLQLRQRGRRHSLPHEPAGVAGKGGRGQAICRTCTPSPIRWTSASSRCSPRASRTTRTSTRPSSACLPTADALLVTGERIFNLERHYNNLAGFREGSDTLPQRFLD